MSPLSHRDRVLAVLNHQTPDRIPIDLGGCPASGINLYAAVAMLGIAASVIIIGLDVAVFAPALQVELGNAAKALGEGSNLKPPAWQGFLASFYGGIDEEVLLRLFVLSLLAWLGKFISHTAEGAPTLAVLWSANILAAVLFGLGHLPATSVLHDLALQLYPAWARFLETSRDNDGALHASIHALANDAGHGRRWGDDDRQVHRLGHLGDRRVGLDTQHARTLRIDREHGPAERAADEVPQDCSADAARRLGGAHYRDVLRREEHVQRLGPF